MHSSLRTVACAAAIAFALPAHSLGTPDGTVIPPSEVLYDGATGLDWLRLDYDSLPGTTWDQAASHAPGFRLATVSELTTFFAGLGLDELDFRNHPGMHGGVIFLLEEWGTLKTTYWDNPQHSLQFATSSFWLADSEQPGTHFSGAFQQAYEEFAPGVGELWSVGVGAIPDTATGSGRSAALVRVHVNVIPEPETYLLLAGGLAALLLRRSLR